MLFVYMLFEFVVGVVLLCMGLLDGMVLFWVFFLEKFVDWFVVKICILGDDEGLMDVDCWFYINVFVVCLLFILCILLLLCF